MDLITFLRDFWPVICGVGFIIAWCSKLQAEVNHQKVNYEGQKEHLNAKIESLQTAITALITAVARLEGKLESRRDH